MADIYLECGCDAVEISIPSPNPCYEKESIRTWMQQAYAREPDHEVYFEAVRQIRQRHPDNEIYTMVYEFNQVTPGRYAGFCREAGVGCVISANMTPESVRILDENGVARCSFGSFILDPKRLALCLRPGGLIYMQTKPFPGQTALPGYETLDKVIGYMRDLGISRPIYCGGGIILAIQLSGVMSRRKFPFCAVFGRISDTAPGNRT